MRVYEVNGPLPRGHATYTVREDVENEAINLLSDMHYVQIIEPRQQGKTSFFNRLTGVLANMALVYVPVSALCHSSEQEWYGSLCDRVREQLGKAGVIEPDKLPCAENHDQWDRFLRKLAAIATRPVVLVLDEIGAAAAFEGASDFFATLHAVFTSRGADPKLRNITFLLLGAADPANLIKHGGISDPLSVAARVRLRDFKPEEVRGLVEKGPWPRQAVAELAARIYDWAEGHPHLTQLLCSRLDANSNAEAVDHSVERLRREGEVHLRSIRIRLNADPNLQGYFDRILGGERILFYPEEFPLQRELELLGLIKGDPRFCRVRTEIYRLVFAKPEFDVFISYRRKGGDAAADSIQARLRKEQVRVFLDVKSLRAGAFSTQLYRTIGLAPVFVPVLSVGCFDQSVNAVDWMRQEILNALRLQKLIVPAVMNGFDFPDGLPQDLLDLSKYQAVDFNRTSFDDGLTKLCTYVKDSLRNQG